MASMLLLLAVITAALAQDEGPVSEQKPATAPANSPYAGYVVIKDYYAAFDRMVEASRPPIVIPDRVIPTPPPRRVEVIVPQPAEVATTPPPQPPPPDPDAKALAAARAAAEE